MTPTTAGQRIPVTGTPASNGTRAQYLDETGNTAQARATFLFGPLCELAVTQGLLTEAVVSAFRASPADGGGVLLEWKTASEAGTVGFYVQRWDGAAQRWQRVNGELLVGLLARAAGRRLPLRRSGRLARASRRSTGWWRSRPAASAGPMDRSRSAVDWNRPDARAGEDAYERGAHPARGRAARRRPRPPGVKRTV